MAELVAACAVSFALGTLAAAALVRRRGVCPPAELLGRVVEVRKYEASDWERARVVAVSWHGAFCVRRVGEQRVFWIDKDRAPERVREIGGTWTPRK